MTKILIIISLLVIAIIIIFFFDRKNITEHFTDPLITTSETTAANGTTVNGTTVNGTTGNGTATGTTGNGTATGITVNGTTVNGTTGTTGTTGNGTAAGTTSGTTTGTTGTTAGTESAATNYNSLLQATNEWVRTHPIATETSVEPTSDLSQPQQQLQQQPQITIPIVENPQIMVPVGQQTVSNQVSSQLLNQISIVDFLSVVLTYVPWGAYYAGNILNDNILLDLLNRPERNAVITGNITKNNINGNGAIGNIKSILGTVNTYIEWPNNSIPEKFTICSITRYIGVTNNKRILTARDATPTNDWIHGHKSGQKGVVYYNDEFKTISSPNMRISGELTDWVITCSKNDGTPPNNIYINGISSGIKSGGKGGLKLSINKIDNTNIINEVSDFGLSYVIIWDTCLSDKALKIVSDTLVKYLQTGEELLFDMHSLSIDDKFKVLDAKSQM